MPLLSNALLNSLGLFFFSLDHCDQLTSYNQEPFAVGALPELRDGDPLDFGKALIMQFNSIGTLLAVGCNDGRVIIWDFDTKNIGRNLIGHLQCITSIGWSHDDRLLYSSSSDWTIIIWDVLSGLIHSKVYFNSPILHSQMHPRLDNIILVCPLSEAAVLVDINTKDKTVVHAKKGTSDGIIGHGIFDKLGNVIYLGDNNGSVHIIQFHSLRVISILSIKGGAAIKSMKFDRSGIMIAINSTDRTLRVYKKTEDSPDIEPVWEHFTDITDPVNRLQWKTYCFSRDAENLISGSAERAEHNIIIWSLQSPAILSRVLEGPKEGLMHVCWHPRLSILLSCSTSGLIYIWKPITTQHWSAYTPDFKELEENIEYQEREDEFDIMSENEEEEEEEESTDEEELEVDVVSVVPLSSESDIEDEIITLPIIPETDSTNFPDVFTSLVPNLGSLRDNL